MVPAQATIPDEYATTEEAAGILGVSRVTVLRWIKRGTLEAYTLGPRRFGIKRTDLAKVARKHEPAPKPVEAPGLRYKMTPEEVERGWAALRAGREVAARIAEHTKGQPWVPTWQLLNELRDERAADLDR